jgi:hypothetical protein
MLPTDKPSRLHFDSKFFLSTNPQISRKINSIVEGRNIYITSDEKIKEGDYVYRDSGIVFKMTQELLEYYESRKDKDTHKRYKIILTTDQDLIKDDVRAINDTFLEWFVKNTSCESVEVDSWSDDLDGYWLKKYKIIIPSEEPKQELPKVGTKEFNDLASACFGGKPKQETAVEFQTQQIGILVSKLFNDEISKAEFHFTRFEICDQAKEMEKQQIIDAYWEGCLSWDNDTEAEQYYNEQFKNK